MKDEFEKLAAAGKLDRHHIEALVRLTTSGFCMHRSWGFGRIKTMDPVFGRFTIDFEEKPGHTMDLTFAAESLKPIPKDHILACKVTVHVRHLACQDMVFGNRLEGLGGKGQIHRVPRLLFEINCEASEDGVHGLDPAKAPASMHTKAAGGQPHQGFDMVAVQFAGRRQFLEFIFHNANYSRSPAREQALLKQVSAKRPRQIALRVLERV